MDGKEKDQEQREREKWPGKKEEIRQKSLAHNHQTI